jgi:cytochrome P450
MAIVDQIESLLYEEIGERRYDPSRTDRDDVLSMLVRPQTHEEGFMSDREIRDELLTLLIAGHETTATAISWTFERLLRHPNAVARLTDEIDRGIDDPYLDAVMRETLRLRPVLPITARKLTKPIELGGWTFPAGWTLMPCMYLMHRDPDVFPEPERFRPERFLSEPMPSSRVWVPFGAGARHCIGSGLSVMAIKVIVKTVLTRTRLAAANAADERIVRRNFTLGPEHGASVVLTHRLQARRRIAEEAPAGRGPGR